MMIYQNYWKIYNEVTNKNPLNSLNVANHKAHFKIIVNP